MGIVYGIGRPKQNRTQMEDPLVEISKDELRVGDYVRYWSDSRPCGFVLRKIVKKGKSKGHFKVAVGMKTELVFKQDVKEAFRKESRVQELEELRRKDEERMEIIRKGLSSK